MRSSSITDFYNLVLAESFTRIFRLLLQGAWIQYIPSGDFPLHLYPAVQALSYLARASDFATIQASDSIAAVFEYHALGR